MSCYSSYSTCCDDEVQESVVIQKPIVKKKLVEFDELFEAHNQILLKMVAALIQSTY